MSYIGRQNLGGAYRQLDDISSGFDGSDTTHTMQVTSQNVTVGDVNQILLSLGGVIQKPGTDFTVSGSTLTFTTAPAANTSFFAVLLGSDNGGTVTPTDLSVSTGKIAADAVTKAKLADSIDVFAGTSLTAADLGSGLDVRVADSSASVDAAADELVLEDSGNAGLSILSGTTSTGQVAFGDSGDNNRALISYSHNTDHMTITHEGDESIVMGGGRLHTGGETTGDVSAGGLILNQGASDTQILSFKSSDIAHGITSGTGNNAETDTYGSIQKVDADNGGLKLSGYTEGSSVMAIEFFGYSTTPSSAFSVSSQGIVQIRSAEKSGSSYTSAGNDDNIFGVKNGGSTKFIVRGDGDIGYDGGASAYDEYEDAHLARALDLSHGNGIIDSKFDQFVKYNHEDLAKAGLVGREEDGTPNHFINITGFQRLHNGAIWQQYEKHQRLAEAVYEMAKEALGEDKADAILEKHDIKLLN